MSITTCELKINRRIQKSDFEQSSLMVMWLITLVLFVQL